MRRPPRTRAARAAARALAALLCAAPFCAPPGVPDAHAETLVPPPTGHTLGFDRVTARELALVLPGVRIESPAGIAVAKLAPDATSSGDSGGAKKSSPEADQVTVVAVDAGTGFVLSNGKGPRAIVWGREEEAIGPLRSPHDVAIDRSGRIAVTDTGNRRVVLLEHDGSAIFARRAFDGFDDPRGIAADGRGGFYVCDRGSDALIHLDTRTGKRTPFGLEVSFDRPIAVATIPEGDRLARNKRRRVAVVDRDGARIRLLSVEGSVVAGEDASALGASARFDDVELDYYGNVLAVDRAGHCIHKMRDDLLPLDTFGSRGTGRGRFESPRGIAVQRSTGQVFVTEQNGGRYLWVGTDIRDFRAEPSKGSFAWSMRLTEESSMTLRILDASGRVVAVLVENARHPAGDVRGTWDGTNGEGARVPNGEYVAEARARATYSSRSSYEASAERRFRWERPR
jgi:DNA-binding beta-propeller fold protein YncE